MTDSVSSPVRPRAPRPSVPGPSCCETSARRIAFRNAERRAKRDAGGLGINLGLAAGIGKRLFAGLIEKFRCRGHHEIDAADIVRARAHQHVDHAGDLGDIAQPDRHVIAGAIADDGRRAGAVRRVLGLRLQRQPRGLDILRIDAGGLQRQQHLAHRRVVGVRGLARGFGLRGEAAIDLRHVGRHRYGGFAADGNHGRGLGLRQRRGCEQQGRNEERRREQNAMFHGSHFSGT